MRNHQCSCGCGEPYRISPSSFPSALSIGILRFPQVFSGFFRFCSHSGTFCLKKPSKIADFGNHHPLNPNCFGPQKNIFSAKLQCQKFPFAIVISHPFGGSGIHTSAKRNETRSTHDYPHRPRQRPLQPAMGRQHPRRFCCCCSLFPPKKLFTKQVSFRPKLLTVVS